MPRLPELKLGPAKTMGLVHNPLHGEVVAHAAHDPPQSTPVSLPFCTPSVQLAVEVTPTAVEVVTPPALSVARAVSE